MNTEYTNYIEETGVTELLDKALEAYNSFDSTIKETGAEEAKTYAIEAKKYIDEIENLGYYSKQMEPFQDLLKEAAGYLNDAIEDYQNIGYKLIPDMYEKEIKENEEDIAKFNDCIDQAVNWVSNNTDLEVIVEDVVEESKPEQVEEAEPQLTGAELIKDYEEKTGIQKKINYMLSGLQSMQSTIEKASSDLELVTVLYDNFDKIETFYKSIQYQSDIPEPLEELYGLQFSAAGEFYRAAKCYINSLDATTQAEMNKQFEASRRYIDSATSLFKRAAAWIDDFESNS